MTSKRLTIASLTFVLTAACATSPTGRKQVILLPDDQMNAMGVAAFDQMKTEAQVDPDPAVNAYVRCVATAITNEVGSGDWEVLVFADATPNAFALPGGKIGVHSGLLEVAVNQDQLASVLGHEVGHVLARHGSERVSEGLLMQGGLASVDAILGDSESKGILMGALGLGAQFGIMLPHSRSHESEADKIGQELMAKAGFDPQQSVTLWENMAAAGGGQPPEFMSTHPSHNTRTTNLKAWMPKALELRKTAQAAGKKPVCKPVKSTTKPMPKKTEEKKPETAPTPAPPPPAETKKEETKKNPGFGGRKPDVVDLPTKKK